jgi:hypothetical protein
MVAKNEAKGQIVLRAQELITGISKHLTGTTPLNLEGQPVTPAEITAKLQAIVTLRSNVNAAKAQTKTKLAAETAQLPALRKFMAALVSYLKGAYAGSPDVLADFGITPKVRGTATVDAKAAAVAKRAATRAARHTMGSQQKKAVKGNVTGVVMTPVTEPVAANPPAAAPAAPANTAAPPATTTAAPTQAPAPASNVVTQATATTAHT